MFTCSFLKTSFIEKYANIFFILSLVSLTLVLVPGIGNNAFGAQRWINIAGFSLQPLEFTKLACIIYFAKVFSKYKNINVVQICLSLGIPVLLLILQPNMSGASLITAIVLFMYYLSGQPIKQLFYFLSITLCLGLLLIVISPYRRERLLSLGSASSYHSKQIQMAIGSGGIFGIGLGNSQQKYKFIPQLSKDSIGATIAEETGLVGILALCLAYIFLTKTIFEKSKKEHEFSNLVNIGVGFWISIQAIVNLSSLTGIIPLTGVTLPFISYGGSSLISLFIATGLVLRKT